MPRAEMAEIVHDKFMSFHSYHYIKQLHARSTACSLLGSFQRYPKMAVPNCFTLKYTFKFVAFEHTS